MRKSGFVGVVVSILFMNFVLPVPKPARGEALGINRVNTVELAIDQSEPGVSASSGESCNELVFDLRNTMHVVDGFGVHLWADQIHGLHELPNLNMKYIRITHEDSTLEDLKKARAFTDRHGIKWLYMLWRAPRRFVDDCNRLVDVAGFAALLVRFGCIPGPKRFATSLYRVDERAGQRWKLEHSYYSC